jgi:hypothetical protein
MQSQMEPTEHTFRVEHHYGAGPEQIELRLLGGYTRGRRTIVLFRFPIDSADATDGMLEILADGRTVRPVEDITLMLDVESGDWDRYADLPVGTSFMLGGVIWTKRHPDSIAKKLQGPMFAERRH